jgi:hypothetical protein
MSNKSRRRVRSREYWDQTDPRPGMFYDPGRDGSPYTFEGQMGRLQNEIGSVMSPDPEFRKKAQFRFFVMQLPGLIMAAIVLVVVLVQALSH